jgi:hypothetical protein
VKHFKAIAAMSLDRVIGFGGKIPWHLPEDFRWFKRMTTGDVVVMGRKTFESIGKALPDRKTIVLSRSASRTRDVTVVRDQARLIWRAKRVRSSSAAARRSRTGPAVVLGVVSHDCEAIRAWRRLLSAFEDRFVVLEKSSTCRSSRSRDTGIENWSERETNGVPRCSH